MCGIEPGPVEAKLKAPLASRARSTRSATVRMPLFGAAISTTGVSAIWQTGAKSPGL